jgi:hypothetical protein
VGFRIIPQNSKSEAYELVLADSGKHILHPSADTTARIFTIPANSTVAFPIGTAITFINQNGAGVVTIAIAYGHDVFISSGYDRLTNPSGKWFGYLHQTYSY